MTEISAVASGIWRGPRLDPSTNYALFKEEFGIKTFLNLEAGWWERIYGKNNCEFFNCITNRIDPLHMEMSDLLPPTFEELFLGASILADPTRQPIYVHCLHGKDRTGAVVAAYRVIYQGWTAQQAIDEMLSMGFHKTAYFYWIPSIRANLKRLEGRRNDRLVH